MKDQLGHVLLSLLLEYVGVSHLRKNLWPPPPPPSRSTRARSARGRLGASDTDVESGQDEAPGIVRVWEDGLCRELLQVPAEHPFALLA